MQFLDSSDDNLTRLWLATTPPHVEDLASAELSLLGAEEVIARPHAVHFRASEKAALNIVLWARTLSRLLEPLTSFPCQDAETLYAGIAAIAWEEKITQAMTFRVHATQGRNPSPSLSHTHFVSLVVKDAVVDRCREKTGWRPDVAHDAPPDLLLMLHLENGEAFLSLDVAGPLHRRGAERPGALAPLRENLAAAILMRSGWLKAAHAKETFIDPMCGSGTLVIEAASMAAGQAPGLLRELSGAAFWSDTRRALWASLKADAKAAFAEKIREASLGVLYGFDSDVATVRFARARAEALGLGQFCSFQQLNFLENSLPQTAAGTANFIVTNPPYGRRLGEQQNMFPLYAQLGQALRRLAPGTAHLIIEEDAPSSALGLRAHKRHALSNGGLACTLHHFSLRERAESNETESASPGAKMFQDRIQKNLKRLKSWREQEKISCLRVYDADLPEYALAIDLYGPWVHVQEYAPPKTIEPQKRARRLREAMAILPKALGIQSERLILKVRDRQRGTQQYGRDDSQAHRFCITEDGMRFWVDLTTYLDTGFFIDHREVRREVRARSNQKRFLNLFSYTCSMTVAAAAGGATETVSVDASQTYLAWAENNFAENHMRERYHHLVRDDAVAVASQLSDTFDLIFVNPPVFSNSKRFDGVFLIQEDHETLLGALRNKLTPDGSIFFTTHAKKFILSETLHASFSIQERTRDWNPRDFNRAKPPFRGWELKLKKCL